MEKCLRLLQFGDGGEQKQFLEYVSQDITLDLREEGNKRNCTVLEKRGER